MAGRRARWASFCLCAWLATTGCATTFDASSPAGAARASNRFGFDLYARAKVTGGGGNLICSPASAAVALTMTSAGARGQTREEMVRVLHLDAGNLTKAHASFGSLVAALNGRDGTDGVALRVADRLWGQQGVAFKGEFLALLRDRYRAPLEEVDFVSAPEEARQAINRWAAAETRDRIQNVIPPGALDKMTRLVLTNAIYFKGAWVRPFAPRETRDREFFTLGRGGIPVRMMSQVAPFGYARVGDLQIAELPYKGGLSMVVVLPDAVDGLAAAEARVADSYQDWLSALRRTEISLELPRWKLTSHLSLAKILHAMGMRLALARGADFSGISDRDLFIDKVLQQAFVEVNELGTEAAAVTAVIGSQESDDGTPPPPRFHADHPFLYFIRDTTTGAILFMGRLVDPESSG